MYYCALKPFCYTLEVRNSFDVLFSICEINVTYDSTRTRNYIELQNTE